MFFRSQNNTLIFLDGDYTDICSQYEYDKKFEKPEPTWIEWFISFWWG